MNQAATQFTTARDLTDYELRLRDNLQLVGTLLESSKKALDNASRRYAEAFITNRDVPDDAFDLFIEAETLARTERGLNLLLADLESARAQ